MEFLSYYGTQIADAISVTRTEFLLLVLVALVLALLAAVLGTIVVVRRMSYPVYDYAVKKAEEEATRIVGGARENARSIIAGAEEQSAQLLEKRREEIEQRAGVYKESLDALTQQSRGLVEEHRKLLQQAGERLKESLDREVAVHGDALEKEAARSLAGLSDSHQKLSAEFAEKYRERLEQELQAARSAVDTYREAQLRLIDKRVVALVERAAALAFQKEFTVQEHTDSIYRALEEAKREGVI